MITMTAHTGDFSEWRNYILAAIKENTGNVEKLQINITEIRVDIGKLKLLSMILGGIAGMLGTFIIMLLYSAMVGI